MYVTVAEIPVNLPKSSIYMAYEGAVMTERVPGKASLKQ